MRPWRGLNLLASYTLAHAIDHVSGLNIGGEPRPMLPVTIGDEASIDAALAREKGDALFDARHRFVLSFGYELPRLDDRGAADAARPRRLAAERDRPGADRLPADGHRADQRRADVADQPAEHDLRSERERRRSTTAQWFNTRCFQRLTLAANAGQVGNEARNAVRGPGFKRTDLSLFKNFDARAASRCSCGSRAFNLFNQERFGQPGNTLGAATFGAITAADDGRIVQLGIKYTF